MLHEVEHYEIGKNGHKKEQWKNQKKIVGKFY